MREVSADNDRLFSFINMEMNNSLLKLFHDMEINTDYLNLLQDVEMNNYYVKHYINPESVKCASKLSGRTNFS